MMILVWVLRAVIVSSCCLLIYWSCSIIADLFRMYEKKKHWREHCRAVDFHAEHPDWERKAYEQRFIDSLYSPNHSARGL
jgi:hypothetical protein